MSFYSVLSSLASVLVVVLALSIANGMVEVKFNTKRAKLRLRQIFYGEDSSSSSGSSNQQAGTTVDAPEILQKHTELFNKEVLLVHEEEEEEDAGTKKRLRVYMAIGWGLANVVLADDGEHGLLVIDALETKEAMRDLLESDDGFKGILRGRKIAAGAISHHHQDHVGGFSAVVEHSPDARIIAHDTTVEHMASSPVVGPITYTRAMRQFGCFIENGGGHINSGIGKKLHQGSTGLIDVNETFSGERAVHNIKVGRWSWDLIHVPGETPDQIVFFTKTTKKSILVASDNIYQSLPNTYAIRGSPSRNPWKWIESLDVMRGLRSDIMLPLHTRPVHGESDIFSLITDYRDAQQFIHDQTVFHMNRGKVPDEIVQRVRLPPRLEQHAWLQPFYGSVRANSRAVFNHYLGHFSGHPVVWNPSKPGALSAELAASTGGAAQLIARAQILIDESNKKGVGAEDSREHAQLALELSNIVVEAAAVASPLSSSSTSSNSNKEAAAVSPAIEASAKSLRRTAIKKLASLSVPATVRNYFLTWLREEAGEIENVIPQDLISRNLKFIRSGVTLLRAMAVNLDAEASEGVNWLAEFNFTDSKEHLFLHVRECIADVIDGKNKAVLLPLSRQTAPPDVSIEVTRKAWVEVIAKERQPVAMIATGELKTSSVLQMAKFRSLFASPRDGL